MSNKDVTQTYTHVFKVHVPNLLNETFVNAVRPKDLEALRIPLNMFTRYLVSVSERCAQLNDPILNRLMMEMTLYDVADPESDIYDPEIMHEVIAAGKLYAKNLKESDE